SILELDEELGALTCRAHFGWTPEMIRPVPLDASSQIAHTFAAAEPVVLDDVARAPRFTASHHLARLGIASAISVPIRGDAGAVGVLAAHSRHPRSFGEDDVLFMRSVANGVAAALAREQAESGRRATEERL